MTATEVLDNLREHGVTVWVEAGQIKLSAAHGVITDAVRAWVKAVKPDIIRLLTLPPHGSINRPMTVHGRRLTGCPWDGCAGEVAGHEGNNLYLCLKCGWYFELVPPMEGEHLL
jgi:hypothetical protein